MQWIVLDEGVVPIHVPAPSWLHGDEAFWTHALVEADRDAVERLWAIRSSEAELGVFVLEHGAAHLADMLARTCTLERDAMDELVAYVDRFVPEARDVARLAGTAVPEVVAARIVAQVECCRELLALQERTGQAVPPVLFEVRNRRIAQLAAVLQRPELATYGAGFDSRQALLEEAIGWVARVPLVDRGLREDIEHLEGPVLTLLGRKPSARAFAGHEKHWIIAPPEALALAARIAPKVDDDPYARRLLDVLRSLDGVHLMSLAKWHDFVFAAGRDIGPGDVSGVLRIVR